MERSALVVLTTLGSETEARQLVKALLESRCIACGTLLPGARSLYHWEGGLKEEAEVVVLLKTDVSKWEALVAAIRERHPYEVPELLALPVDRGLDSYLSWLTSEVVG
jgi:periplasmic divalent cation tolerance protein